GLVATSARAAWLTASDSRAGRNKGRVFFIVLLVVVADEPLAGVRLHGLCQWAAQSVGFKACCTARPVRGPVNSANSSVSCVDRRIGAIDRLCHDLRGTTTLEQTGVFSTLRWPFR
ncbi:hypothetical protein, partial [Pseudomonas aeruginosa]|uniref:hypothetical protein n=1 Tax=Pseudomonas aeruginosa TaxID=287 RepID=UPI001C38C980